MMADNSRSIGNNKPQGVSDKFPNLGNDHYEVLRRLGSGGYGDVWEARHRSTGALMAIKLVKRDPKQWNDDAQKEMSTLLKIKYHANIVRTYDYFLTADLEHRATVMELHHLGCSPLSVLTAASMRAQIDSHNVIALTNSYAVVITTS